MPSIPRHHLPPLVRDQPAHQRMPHQFHIVHPSAVHPDLSPDETDAVAVIGVPVDMPRVQGLYRSAVGPVPSIDRDTMGSSLQRLRTAEHHVLLDAADKPPPAPALPLDDQVVLHHGDGTVAVRVHGDRLYFHTTLHMDEVDKLPRRQEAAQLVGDALTRHRGERHPRPVGSSADHEVVTGYLEDRPPSAARRIDPDTPHRYEAMQVPRYLAPEKSVDGEGVTCAPAIGRGRPVECTSGQHIPRRLWKGYPPREPAGTKKDIGRRKDGEQEPPVTARHAAGKTYPAVVAARWVML